MRAPVTWIPEVHGAPALWDALAAAHHDLPGVPAALPELLTLPAPDAAQVLHVARGVRESGVTHLHAHFATLATTVARLAGAVLHALDRLTADRTVLVIAHHEELLASCDRVVRVADGGIEEIRGRTGPVPRPERRATASTHMPTTAAPEAAR
ncbi:hypothetical protein [Pseudonocardia nigra]|uniref:hypothetical protein n=1 Tax=Pseudonocardia nigra TaxID=1921578 RepID=UPI001C5ECBAD|nr:hypothetical protein [Pseudonocardia nigra]